MRAVTLALLIAAGIAACAAQSMSAEEEEMLEEMGVKGTPMGRKDQTPKAEVIKSDLKYIRCEVCRMGVAVAYEKARSILEKRFKYQKKRKNEAVEFDGEEAVQDFVEAMCDSDKPEGPGAWIRHLDLVASGDRLEVREHAGYGHCERECRTIERACEEFVDAADTDFTEILYEAVRDGTELEKVQRLVCNRAAGVCKKKAPPLPPGRKDYAFRAMSDDEKQMNDMMANLKASGMGGTMYRREDLAKGMDSLKAQFGDEFGAFGDDMADEGEGEADDADAGGDGAAPKEEL